MFFNQNGINFSSPVNYAFGNDLSWNEFDRIQFTDVVGNGKNCLLLSKQSPHIFKKEEGEKGEYRDTAHYYYEFNFPKPENKAFLLSGISNNMGVQTDLVYKSSLKDYLAAEKEGKPWNTKLPFPIMVLEKSTVSDYISGSTYSSEITYRDGYYDPVEHSFVGFGSVTHIDTPDTTNNEPTAPPLLTKQWFHLGIGTEEETIKKEFYQGEIADKIDSFMKANGGYISREDLSSHSSTWVEPVSTNYRGYDVFELPPNGQGIAALQMLNMLEPYNLADMGFLSEQALHVMTEAKKLAFEDRAKFYADPDFFDVPLSGLIDKKYALARKKLIGERAAKRVDAGNPAMYQGDTIYLTTADKSGNMVSLIQSNYRGMGSGVVVPGLGFVFQDRGQLFSMDKSHANAYQANKRPFHTIIPAFVMKDDKPFISFGLMGGAMQPQGHVQIVTNIIDFGMNLQEAGDATRWQHFGSTEPTEANGKTLIDGGQLVIESDIPYQTVRGLMQRGHKIGFDMGGYGGYQAIMWDDKEKVYYGASESRKDGQAAGY